jgi:S-adenosylmethionine synthetase
VRKLITSESVTGGHPDKLCDQIADAVLDDVISQDPNARVACEVCATTGLIMVMGEVTTAAYSNIAAVARRVVTDAGYSGGSAGFDGSTCAIIVALDEQSPDIALGVNRARSTDPGDRFGAGDQGMVYGYASDETPELMPLPITLAHALVKRLETVRRDGTIPYLRPDGKSQVTMEYCDGVPARVDAVVVSAQHDPSVAIAALRRDIYSQVIRPIIPDGMLDGDTRIFINPTGRFEKGGPAADSGLTGRKLMVDTYGGVCRHGGGAFSGKDPTKVDRSGAYAARHAAKNIVAAGAAKRCEVQIAYAIGVARPVAISVDTFGTGAVPDSRLEEIVDRVFDLRPAAIIDRFDLRRPIYRQTAVYGHFGRPELDLPWERLDFVADAAAQL